jgi:hypothetical protein
LQPTLGAKRIVMNERGDFGSFSDQTFRKMAADESTGTGD